MGSYQSLKVWQKAMDLATEIYRLTEKLPDKEIYSLVNQMRRAAVSIPSNIAEGQDRHSTKEFINFLSIARGSKAELETQLQICVNVNYLKEEDILQAKQSLVEIGSMLSVFISKLKNTD